MTFTANMSGTTELDNSQITQYESRFLIEARQGLVVDQAATVGMSINGVAATFPRYKSIGTGAELSQYEDTTSTAMDDESVIILPKQYGQVITLTELTLAQSGGIVNQAALAQLGQSASETKNLLGTLALSASTNVVTAGGKALDAITAGDVMDKATLVKTYAKLKSAFAGKIAGDYVLFMHPSVIADLKLASTTGSWEDVSKYTSAEGALSGEVGRWQGFRIIENSACKIVADGGDAAVDLYESYAVGLNGLGLGVTQDLTFTFSQNDKQNRFTHIGWKGIFGYKIIENSAVVKVVTASSLGANA